MFGCLSLRAISPSLGFFSSGGKRASKRFVLSLSSTLRATIFPDNVSRARQTRDMLPCPIRPISSKRRVMSVLGSRFLGWKRFLKNFMRQRSFCTVVDDAGNLGPQLRARDDAIDEAVRQHELAGLEPLGELVLD